MNVPLVLGLACFALSPTARAVVPAPDGGYTNANTAEGTDALFSLNVESGVNNTAVGFDALFSDVVGSENTSVGFRSLNLNTASSNTAVGFDALQQNTSGFENTAVGHAALADNGTGFQNTAVGSGALVGGSGNNNTAVGWRAALLNFSGINNTAIGSQALINSSGTNNIGVGVSAGTNLRTGSNNIYIGSSGGSDGESKRIRIGNIGLQNNAFIAGIFGVTVGTGVGVIIDSSGRLGTTTSSERYKDAIRPMAKESEAILALRPVTFHYKHELDPDGTPQFGLVAEQVEKVDRDLVVRDDQGKPYTVRYEAVNAMLLNEFLKQHRKVEEQGQRERKMEAIIVEQQKQIAALTASLRGQAAEIKKVSGQLATIKPLPRLVDSN